MDGYTTDDLIVARGSSVVAVRTGPVAQLGTTALTFGSVAAPVPQGTLGAPRTVTVTNDGLDLLAVGGFTVDGADADDFFVSGDTCRANLVPGASCTFQVRLAPQAAGARSARLTVLPTARTR